MRTVWAAFHSYERETKVNVLAPTALPVRLVEALVGIVIAEEYSYLQVGLQCTAVAKGRESPNIRFSISATAKRVRLEIMTL